MKWALIAIGSLVAIAGLVAAIGMMLPKGHRASVARAIAAPPDKVWAMVSDLASWPSWNPGVKAMERLPDRDGQAVWAFPDSGMKITVRVLETSAPDGARPGRLRTRIDDASLPFGGTWTWEISAAGAGAEVRITEDGEIYNPVFRFMARFVMGYEGTLRAYLDALGDKLGSPARS